MNKLITLKFHGDLAEWMVHKEWKLNVKSIKEAINAINCLTENKLNRYFIEKNKLKAKYRVLINGKDFRSPVREINEDNYEIIHQTQLLYNVDNLETIDIVPFIESSDSKILAVVTLIAAAILIVVGSFVPGAQGLIFIGLALAMGGVMALLARPPEFQNFRNVDKFGNQSYLFSGPTNIVGEGGPVPVGYGRMLVGSQVISSAYSIKDYQTFRDVNNKK